MAQYFTRTLTTTRGLLKVANMVTNQIEVIPFTVTGLHKDEPELRRAAVEALSPTNAGFDSGRLIPLIVSNLETAEKRYRLSLDDFMKYAEEF